MIDKIALLRQALGSLRTQAVARAGSAGSVRSQASAQGADARALRDAALQRRLSLAIAQIDADDPRRRRHAVRAIVLVSLLREFGDELEGDPAFHQVVEQVAVTMHDEPQLRDSIDLALKDLRDIRWPVN